jgi:ubiquinone/menaquinone biosynthesis C-methylase UbiE
VIALALSLPMLVNGRRRAAERGCDDILFVRGDAQRLPVRDGAVDLLNCFGALHLFPDPERAIREMARSAKPSTLFSCLTTGRPGALSGLRERLLSRLSPLRLFEAEELAGMLAAAGFEDFRPEQHGLVLLFTARTALESG